MGAVEPTSGKKAFFMSPNFVKDALAILKENGYSSTKPRRLVLELLDTASEALSAYEIRDALAAAGEPVDTVSVYRVIRCLEECHLIHRMMATGKILKCQLESEDHCTKKQDDHCHHLLICDGCGDVDEIHCVGIEAVMNKVEKMSRFKINTHNLEFAGLCSKCS